MSAKTITIARLVEPRTATVPADWLIFNAPRPLYGNAEWQGDFRHGIFFAAVNPSDSGAARMIRDNADNDGWLVEYVSESDVREWVKGYGKENGYDFSGEDWRDILQSFYNERGRDSISVESVLERCKVSA